MSTKILFMIGTIILTLVISGTQKYLCTRKFWQLGAVVPIITVAILGVLFSIKNIALSIESVLPCVIIVFLELLVWIDGRMGYRRYELMKMKAKDI